MRKYQKYIDYDIYVYRFVYFIKFYKYKYK